MRGCGAEGEPIECEERAVRAVRAVQEVREVQEVSRGRGTRRDGVGEFGERRGGSRSRGQGQGAGVFIYLLSQKSRSSADILDTTVL